MQFIPKRKRMRKNEKGFAALHNNYLFSIKIPKELGGIKKYKRIKKGLSFYDMMGPDFFTKSQNYFENPYSFDFSKYVSNYEIFVHKLTNIYGWKKEITPQN